MASTHVQWSNPFLILVSRGQFLFLEYPLHGRHFPYPGNLHDILPQGNRAPHPFAVRLHGLEFDTGILLRRLQGACAAFPVVPGGHARSSTAATVLRFC